VLLDRKQVLDSTVGQKLRRFLVNLWEGLKLAVNDLVRRLTCRLLDSSQTHFFRAIVLSPVLAFRFLLLVSTTHRFTLGGCAGLTFVALLAAIVKSWWALFTAGKLWHFGLELHWLLEFIRVGCVGSPG
jgi:hypothetical protein